jgi:hypothetical protein
MSARRLDAEIGPIWHDDALKIYMSGISIVETTRQLNEKYPVSHIAVRKFLRQSNVTRNHSDQQKLKRWRRSCIICHNEFMGRTPTVLFCDTCYGDDTPGMTSTKTKMFTQYMAPILREKNYGLDQATFDALLQKQNYRCGLCNNVLDQPCVEHNHLTGKVRGITCHRCNLTLGHVEWGGGHEWLTRAHAWLERG